MRHPRLRRLNPRPRRAERPPQGGLRRPQPRLPRKWRRRALAKAGADRRRPEPPPACQGPVAVKRLATLPQAVAPAAWCRGLADLRPNRWNRHRLRAAVGLYRGKCVTPRPLKPAAVCKLSPASRGRKPIKLALGVAVLRQGQKHDSCSDEDQAAEGADSPIKF